MFGVGETRFALSLLLVRLWIPIICFWLRIPRRVLWPRLMVCPARTGWSLCPSQILFLEAWFLEGWRCPSAPAQFSVDDGCFASIIYFLEVVRKAWCHCPYVPRSQFQGGSFLFFFLLPGAQLYVRLSVFTLNPTYPVRLTDSGGVAPYWLGTAQLKAGGSCPVRCDDLSQRLQQPLGSNSMPVYCRLITGRLLLPVFCRCCKTKLEWLLQSAKPG